MQKDATVKYKDEYQCRNCNSRNTEFLEITSEGKAEFECYDCGETYKLDAEDITEPCSCGHSAEDHHSDDGLGHCYHGTAAGNGCTCIGYEPH